MKTPKNKDTNESRPVASHPVTPLTPVTIAAADEVLAAAASLALLPPGVTPRASWILVTAACNEASMAGACSATPWMKIRARPTMAPAQSRTTRNTASPRARYRSSQFVNGSVMTARTNAAVTGTIRPLSHR